MSNESAPKKHEDKHLDPERLLTHEQPYRTKGKIWIYALAIAAVVSWVGLGYYLGKEQGREIGMAQGYEQGQKDGLTQGYAEARDRLAQTLPRGRYIAVVDHAGIAYTHAIPKSFQKCWFTVSRYEQDSRPMTSYIPWEKHEPPTIKCREDEAMTVVIETWEAAQGVDTEYARQWRAEAEAAQSN